MPTILTSSQQTFVDITDQRKLSAYITSNLPKTQSENPNVLPHTYAPSWASTNLTLTPVVFLDQTNVALNSSGLTITWKRKDGSGAETALNSNEKVTGGILKVNSNVLAASSTGMITYICYISYYDSETKNTVNITSDITYTLVRNAENAKLAYVTADTYVFKYNASSALVGASQATLTAQIQGVSISKWQYKNSSGAWADYPTTSDNTSITGGTLVVKPAHTVFVDNVAQIKLLTDDADVYDTISITKMYDGSKGSPGSPGAAGTGGLSIILGNEAQTIACSSSGAATAALDITIPFTGYVGITQTACTCSVGTLPSGMTLTDSRGRTSAAATVSISVVAYSPPSFSSYNSQRCNSGGTLTDDGTYIKGTVSYSFASCSSKNTVTRSTYYRVAGSSTWTNASASFNSGTAFTFGGGKISTETSYEVRYDLKDAFSTISITDIVSTASVVMDFKSGGKGVAVGKVSETDNCFEVSEKWDVKVYGKLLKDYIKEFTGALYPVGSIYMSVKNTNPSTYFGGTWVAWGTGRVPVGVNANDTNFATAEKTGGASTVTLTTAQMPSHTHAKGTLATASAGGHTHDLKNQKASWGTSGGNRVLIDATSGYTAVSNKTTTSAGSHSHTISGSTAATGSGSAHNNLQPYITCYMWKRTA